LEAEMLEINNELQKLVQLRRSPTLKIASQERWATLKTRASDLLNVHLSCFYAPIYSEDKCIKVHNAASMHFVSNVHLIEDQAPLYLANTPYLSKS